MFFLIFCDFRILGSILQFFIAVGNISSNCIKLFEFGCYLCICDIFSVLGNIKVSLLNTPTPAMQQSDIHHTRPQVPNSRLVI